MIIYQCDNPNCAKTFEKREALLSTEISIGTELIEYYLCNECSEKFKTYVTAFLVPPLPPVPPEAPLAQAETIEPTPPQEQSQQV